MNKFPAIIAYDIHDNRRRYQVYKRLQEWRVEGQNSVIECLLSRQQAESLFDDLQQMVDPEKDKLFLAWITPHRPIHNRGTGHSLGFFAKFFDIK